MPADISTEPGHTADHLVGPAVRGALVCLLWLADADAPSGEYVPNLHDVPADVEMAVREDVTDFVLANADDLLAYVEARSPHAVAEYDGQTSADWAAECIGHDFILTRNHHGAGFWDRGLGDLGDRLTKASDPYGTIDLDIENGSITLM